MGSWGKVFKPGLVYLFLHLGLLIGFWLKNHPDGKLHLVICDVGQGDAVLVISPQGKQILIDAGPGNAVLECLGDYMLPWDKTIEVIIISHAQSDHITGLYKIHESYENIHTLIDKSELIDINNIITADSKLGFNNLHLQEIDILEYGNHFTVDGVNFETIWPPKGYHSADPNENSLVLRLEYGDFSALLTGDATDKVWRSLELIDKLPPETTVLKVPHHGAKNCCTTTLIKILQPKLALISVGKDNRFGHPHRDTIRMLEKDGIGIKRTDLEGRIELVVWDDQLVVNQERMR